MAARPLTSIERFSTRRRLGVPLPFPLELGFESLKDVDVQPANTAVAAAAEVYKNWRRSNPMKNSP